MGFASAFARWASANVVAQPILQDRLLVAAVRGTALAAPLLSPARTNCWRCRGLHAGAAREIFIAQEISSCVTLPPSASPPASRSRPLLPPLPHRPAIM